MTTLFDPEKHKRTRERLKKLNSFQPFNIPTELTFIGDKKPYVINNKEYKHKKYAKQALKELLKTFPLDLALNLKESTIIFNVMDRYYREPDFWRKFRPYIQSVRYTQGHKYKEKTFYFQLDRAFENKDSELLLTPKILNPGVLGSCLCFVSPNVHDAAKNNTYVAKMFRSAVEDQVLNFRIQNNGQSGIHEVHHADTTFKNIVLSFMSNVMKISDRDKFETDMRLLGKYIASEGQIFDPNIPLAVRTRDAFAEYHKKYAKLILTLKKPHREETSQEIKFNTSLRHKIKELIK